MRVIIEDYQYPAEKVDKVLWDGAFQTVDGKVSIGYVGYYWNEKLRESVFMLPKVMLNQDDKVFDKYAPEDIIDIDASPLTKDEREFLYGFAVWIYRALVVYKESHPTSAIILHRFVAEAGHGRKRLSNTMLDVLLSLMDFLKRNREFITFIEKIRHSGYNKVNWTKTVARKRPVFAGRKVPVYAEIVNRKKEMDRDEELLVIFHSIINYIHEVFGFEARPNLNYDLITGSKFERYLRGYGSVRLRQIKYKYYSDKMLELWDLCYVFFNHSHKIALSAEHKEYLLAKDFNIVFEAIIDELIGDENDGIVRELKEQEDGKLVDHMFSAQGLTNNDEPEHAVYYIGDSKYYKRGNRVGRESVAKQFTYARNVIQWNLNLFLDDGNKAWQKKFPKLRDDVTEGYNIIPNFFISATVDEKLSYEKGEITRRPDEDKLKSRQFENRLFDRDTLLIAHYDINFLFIVALYARNAYSQKLHWKNEMREKFRKDIQEMLQTRFTFYAMTPLAKTDPEVFFREHFQQLLGKVFTPYNDVHEKTTFYSLALLDTTPKPTDGPNDIALKKVMEEENASVLECLGDAFEIAECPLGVNPKDKVTPHEPAPYVEVPTTSLTRHYIANYLDDYFLFGCIKNDGGLHRDWVFKTRGKYKRCAIYNVRLGDRPGAVIRCEKVRTPKFVILYEETDDKCYRVFRVHHAVTVKKERMERMLYPHPSGDYFCYFLDEEVTLGELDVHKIRTTYRHLRDPDHPFAPLYINGGQLAAIMDL